MVDWMGLNLPTVPKTPSMVWVILEAVPVLFIRRENRLAPQENLDYLPRRNLLLRLMERDVITSTPFLIPRGARILTLLSIHAPFLIPRRAWIITRLWFHLVVHSLKCLTTGVSLLVEGVGVHPAVQVTLLIHKSTEHPLRLAEVGPRLL